MGETVLVRVDADLIPVFEDIRKTSAERVKKLFNIDEVKIYDTLASKILAALYKNSLKMRVKVKKVGRNQILIES